MLFPFFFFFQWREGGSLFFYGWQCIGHYKVLLILGTLVVNGERYVVTHSREMGWSRPLSPTTDNVTGTHSILIHGYVKIYKGKNATFYFQMDILLLYAILSRQAIWKLSRDRCLTPLR